MTSTEQVKPWLQTWTGQKVSFPMTTAMMNVDDIAHALSLQCRFAGHIKCFYSVAEHSCLVSDWLFNNDQRDLAMAGLFHDASEAYLVDIPKPVKLCLPDYVALENHVINIVEDWGGFYRGELSHKNVKDIDQRILQDEKAELKKDFGHKWSSTKEPLGIALPLWSPAQAEEEFKNRFERLNQ